ncbi:MAG: diacylglycerol kinase family lipid kinase [Armatimonadetes bacterium]|nr:diacylglycerol kinase family lipid kinase [Armatimonadota bacterium]
MAPLLWVRAMPEGDILVILNPVAGGAKPSTGDEIGRLLAAEGLQPTVYRTTGPMDAQAAARRAVEEGVERIAVAAGDGTVGEVTGALVGTGVAMGLIPLGTGNALGRELNLPLGDLPAACRLVVQGRTRDIDVGVCNGTPFAIMCGVGFDAEVAHASHQGRWKKHLGRWAFVAQFLLHVAGGGLRPFRVTVDGETIEERLWAVVACNASQYTWRLRFAPEGQLDDGGLQVALFAQKGRVRLLNEVTRHWCSGGVCELPGMRCLRGKSIRVEVDPPMRWQADGDVRGMSPVDISVRPKALRLIVGDWG